MIEIDSIDRYESHDSLFHSYPENYKIRIYENNKMNKIE